MHPALRPALLAAAMPLLLAVPAHAQGEPRVSGFFSLGALSGPDYEGSDDSTIGPLLAARLGYGSNYVETATLGGGIGLRVNLSPWPAAEFGPVVALRRGRSDADNARVKRLDEVDDAVEAGAFLRLPFRGLLTARDEAAIELQVLQDASSAHDGTLFTFGGSYRFSPVARLRVGLTTVATYASDDYTETHFGIDARNAAASGLPAFSAGGGIKDVALSLTANYELTPNWGLVGVLGYRRLLGSAADSPIVRREGTENQFSFGLGISYGF